MARTPSVGREIETLSAKAAQRRIAEAELQDLLEADGERSTAPSSQIAADPDAEDAIAKALDGVVELREALELAIANSVLRISGEIDGSFARFEAGAVRTRREKIVAMFSSRRAARLQDMRLRRSATADDVRTLLVSGDVLAGILSAEKTDASAVKTLCEQRLIPIGSERRAKAALIETGRHRLRQINASLATVQWKLGSVTDEARRKTMEAEREGLTLELEGEERSYRAVRTAHDALDRRIVQHETLAQLATLQFSAYSVLYNALSADMERAIQLYGAVSSSLDGLLEESEPLDAASGRLLSELVALHRQNEVALADVVRSKAQSETAMLRRYRMENGRIVGIAR